eukprot:GHVH01001413.1.p1 GENE.GHVH01001413.1~~GHVH01001413.1.p1  ORF type:complete len:261 (+),score=42.40 GHVH01001413.1:43-783(+)
MPSSVTSNDPDDQLWMMALSKLCEGRQDGKEGAADLDLVQINQILHWAPITVLQGLNLGRQGIKYIISLSSPMQFDNAPGGIRLYHFNSQGEKNYRILFDSWEEIWQVYCEAADSNSKLVITDTVGSNRAAMVCGALVMMANKLPVLTSFDYVARAIVVPILQVPAHQREIIDFAKQNNLMDPISRLQAINFNDGPDVQLLSEFQEEILAEFDPDILDQYMDDDAEMAKAGKNVRAREMKKKDLLR